MKKALVCGVGGFIGSHLVNRLKREGFWVRGVDLKYHLALVLAHQFVGQLPAHLRGIMEQEHQTGSCP
jgi:nucleoside-diphosphate-sugar epimerase